MSLPFVMGPPVDAAVTSPTKPRRRRVVRFIGWAASALVLFWCIALAVATWHLHRAVEALRKRGQPTTFAEALARMHAKFPDGTRVELLREALEENKKAGLPGDRYQLGGGSSAMSIDAKQRSLLDAA